MAFNFNEKGKQYGFHAIKGGTSDFEVLSVVSQSALTKIEQEISARYDNAASADQAQVDGLYACIERLRSCLYYSRQISIHQDALLQNKVDVGAAIAASAIEACIDFESFLFHARAALDRLTLQVNREFGGNSDKYSKLANVLKNFPQNKKAKALLEYVEECEPHFVNLLVDGPDNTKSLRSLQMHRASISQSTDTNFSVYRHGKFGLIGFDHYFLGFPLVNTTWETTKWVTYLILKAVTLFSSTNVQLNANHCRPKWEPLLVPFQEFEVLSGGITVTVFSLSNSGFQIVNKQIDSTAFSRK